ncbi:AAA family ATPase [Myroides marinus]|uniref:AAA family ATPase n=2 Tax=Myroides marinus TaxID=703342 RepID=UPI002576BACA|nr:AAA family ATPase [Myroides marinus]MDM1533406.1 AAA family ATPase [Myroides marinus]MDM1540412.1 AAA family ATPase [Myroides marinus]
MYEELYKLKQDFLSTWSIVRLKSMTLQEYSNLNRDTSFCYWIEHTTKALGSVKGGSSYKFGIYERGDKSSTKSISNRSTDGTYAWFNKYGSTADEAFETVRQLIVTIAESAINNQLEVIDSIDLGNAYKWKIAFLYSDYNVVNIFNYDALLSSAESLGYSEVNKSASELNHFILSQKRDEEYYTFTKALWKDYKTPAEEDNEIEVYNEQGLITQNSIELNQIFYGPPGTGKTYHTINESIKIVDPNFYAKYSNDRDKLKERFKLLSIKNSDENLGQIAFTTFHQSFSYEDFVEGIKPIKPETDDTFLKYEVQEGIFKKICRLAQDSLDAVETNKMSTFKLSEEEFDNTQFYKMSLGNTQIQDDKEIFDYCIANDCVTIGFGDGYNFSGLDERALKDFGNEKGMDKFPIQAMNIFKNFLKIGNYVLISNGNNYIRAIGKVVGEYGYIDESPFQTNPTFNHFRKVEWIYKEKNIPVSEIYTKTLSQQTIYKLNKEEINKSYFVKNIVVDELSLPKNPKKFVLIADEINRGNVSSVFGELITLIEKDKRAGNDEELSVILPYSKEEFKVPHNVYIIGTMNTADRSIEALDTALRRRFSFKQMLPNPNLIVTEGKLKDNDGFIDELDLSLILQTINMRIEKLIDKDHLIGHSYFMGVESINDLKIVFRDKVIPLLEEYFFADYGKIGLVLGNSFIKKIEENETEFSSFDGYDEVFIDDLQSKAVYTTKKMNDWDFNTI